VLSVLRPIWETKCETASRLRGRIERILARATVEGRRTGANPATWRGHLQEALPKRSEIQPVVHHSAMEFADVPTFMAELLERKEVSAAALRFLILTAGRTGEVIGAHWDELNLQDRTWTVPPERAKTGRAHVVPLSTGALAVLREMEPLRDVSDGFIFPGNRGAGMSQMTLLALLQRRMGRDVTAHGFRSAFRDWAGDEGDVPRELAEASLAHVVKDATERAYRRKTAIEKRRKVMQAWCDYCMPPQSTQVVDIRTARREAALDA
jgi:integrase